MYKNFRLDSRNIQLTGYEWSVKNPKAVVCLVHGIGEHVGRYNRVAKFFNQENIALISMDIMGHGRSPGKRGHIGTRSEVRKDIDNLITFAEEKYPDIPLIYYGHSLGGNIMLDYRLRGALSAKPIGYIITSPWVKLVRPIPKSLYRIVKIGAGIIPQVTISQNINNEMLGNLNFIRNEEDTNLKHQKISLQTAAEGFDIGAALMDNRLPDVYGGGKIPMLLMHGTKDPICDINGSRIVADNNREVCEYVEWENYLHELHNGTNDKPYEPVLEKMVSWIERCTRLS